MRIAHIYQSRPQTILTILRDNPYILLDVMLQFMKLKYMIQVEPVIPPSNTPPRPPKKKVNEDPARG